MEIVQGCVNVLIFLQNRVHPPIRYIPWSTGITLQVERSFFKGNKHLPKLFWNLNKLLLLSVIVIATFQVKTLFRNWAVGDNVAQICFNTIIITLTSIALSTYAALEKYADEFCFAEKEALKLFKFRSMGYPSLSGRKPGIKEAILYVTSGGFYLLVTPLAPFTAFFIPYHPFVLVADFFGAVDPNSTRAKLLLNIFSNVMYVFGVLHSAGVWLFLIFSAIMFGYSIQTLSYNLFHKPKVIKLSQEKRQIAKWRALVKIARTNPGNGQLKYPVERRGTSDFSAGIKNKPAPGQTRVGFCHWSKSFEECVKLHNMLTILIREGIKVCESFIQILISVGVLLGTCCGFTLIKLYGLIPLGLYIAFSLFIPVFLIVTFTLAFIAAVPMESDLKFKQFWSGKLTSKRNRSQLRSCRMIGYAAGFITKCERKTALTVSDVALNMTACLVLL